MAPSSWFDDTPVLGQLSPQEAAATLRELGEEQLAQRLEASSEDEATTHGVLKAMWPFQDQPWQYTAHAFGYLAPDSSGQDLLPIRSLDAVPADPTLKRTRLKITLDRLRVANYPGGGVHRVLLHFFARNQVAGRTEPAHFNATYRILEGQQAPIRGYPIFVGLQVGNEGLLLQCRTINVKNEQDTGFLDILESDVFQTGLHMASAVQPALVPLSALGLGLAKLIAKRHRNVTVQDFALGLDFNTTTMGARLAEGDYLAVQVPESLQRIWDWDDWCYERSSGQIVHVADRGRLIPYNYLVFGLSRYQGA
jgi:hypothetical protein